MGQVVKKEESFHLGHRERLRDRFMKAPIRSLPDYEILEMILYGAISRGDTKPTAKTLLKKFGSLIEVLNAEPSELKQVSGVGDAVIHQIKLMNDLFSRLHLPVDSEIQILNNWSAVLNYCSLTMGFKKAECFRVLYLNKKNALIADELFDGGTVDKVQVYPREIAKKAIEHGASAVILVHNHPSGEAEPSKEDIEMTKLIVKALDPLAVKVHDHIIVAKHDHYSFKSNQLI